MEESLWGFKNRYPSARSKWVTQWIGIFVAGVVSLSSAAQVITPPKVQVDPNAPISDERVRALQLYKRLTGVPTPIDNPLLAQMEEKIRMGNLVEAAALATDDPNFYSIVVRDFAAKMSTREETVKAPLSDFVATIIGVTRDEIDARLLLSGDFLYRGNADLVPRLPVNEMNDILRSNRHYDFLENGDYDLKQVLVRVDGQKLLNGAKAVVNNPDPAGILTSRAWMQAHAEAGTNRRLVEFSFQQFTCRTMEQWADATSPDNWVGRDIDRYPGGAASKFQTTCKACHTGMDALRGAFAQWDFENGFVKNALLLPVGNGEYAMKQNPVGISAKMNGNATVFPGGHATVDSSWENNAVRGGNAAYFGWRGALSGSGVQQFGTMLANSKAFSKCMTSRVFETLCKRPPATFEQSMIEAVAGQFEQGGYSLKELFEVVATRPECLGEFI